ncbi:MAG: ribonuclease R [bacterium]|nr:ribonuclease R [bacterium]
MKNSNNKNSKKDRLGKIEGIISTHEKGFGFVTPFDKAGKSPEKYERDNDIFIPPSYLNTAFNGDTVTVDIVRKNREGKNEGRIISIKERARTNFVGIIKTVKNGFELFPDDKKIYTPFFIPFATVKSLPPEIKNNIKDGFKAQIKFTVWRLDAKMPEAEIISVLGKKGDHNTEMKSIVLESGFDNVFRNEIEKEAKSWKARYRDELVKESQSRRDLRNTWTCTIDPVDAKDFDDAISFRKISSGQDASEELFEIGVHIADVSHFVRPDTELDREAFKRGCSIYMVDRTVPMLPEVLSNDLCSLNPNEDKFAFSAIFKMNRNGRVLDRTFSKSIINSNKRFTYETAEEAIKNTSNEFHSTLFILNEIAKKLRVEKMLKGAIEFEQDEIKFKLDEFGHPIGVYKKERLDAHKLVEEFMLLANREVAKFISDVLRNKTGDGKMVPKAGKFVGKMNGIYRIHELPDRERIADLSNFVKSLGHSLHLDDEGDVSPFELNKLLESVKSKPEANVIRVATIRSMQKAIYSTKNIGHFGLGFSHYTHFTSPIRRYPDLVVHRILEACLENKKDNHNLASLEKALKNLERIAEQSTEREISAAEAERASIRYKQVEFMAERIGKEFEGTISGVTEWGMFVEDKETKCEGLIRIKSLSDKENEFFIFDKKTYSLIGEKSKKRYRLGDTVKFRVENADLEKKILDYSLI